MPESVRRKRQASMLAEARPMQSDPAMLARGHQPELA
jgi:hypothetical protein